MTIGAESPTPAEIRDQLEHMLASKRFRNAPNQRDFLALAVNRALQGKKTPGHIVAKTLFKDKFLKDESLDVRATASNLRATLKKYYAGEGRSDLVCIALPDPPKDKSIKLPEGEAYTPKFSYNSTHPVSKEFKLGMYYLTRNMGKDSATAGKHFAAVLRLVPEHIGASIGICEALMSGLFWEKEFTTQEELDDLIYQAAGFLDRVYDRASQFWRLHAAGAFMLTEGRSLDKAKNEFEIALKLDRASTEDYPPYFYFLFQIGKKSEAIRLAEQHLETHADSMAAHITCARLFMYTRQPAEAETVLKKALAIDRGYYAVHLLLALISLWQQRIKDALRHMAQVKLLADDLSYHALQHWCWKIIKDWPAEEKEAWAIVSDMMESTIFPLFESS